jgi:hypothetical protein
VPKSGGIIALTLALCAGCADAAEVDCGAGAAGSQPLTNGAASPDYLLLAEEERRAIVHLRGQDPTSGNSSTCTGTFIRDSWILSAAHCAPSDTTVFEADQVDAHGVAARSWQVAELVRHAELDLLLLRVEAEDSSLIPIASSRVASTDLLGQRAQLAGTGRSNDGPVGALRFAVTTIVKVSQNALRVSADGYSGACDGDSGGPLLRRGASGVPELVGVLSRGNVTCFAEDSYVPTSLAADWIEEVAGPTPESTPVCGGVDERGGCFGTVAVHCQDGTLVGAPCTTASSTHCGWSAVEGGFRCVAPDDDPCRGVDQLGTCSDGEALSCVEGRLRRNTCAACGATCVVSPRTGATTCVL